MFFKILLISILILIIAAVIYFLVKGFKSRTAKNKLPKMLLIAIVVAVLVIPVSAYEIIHTTIVLATPVPTINLPSNKLNITGTNRTANLHGKTTPNTRVYLKEVSDIDPIKKNTVSDKNGNFHFNHLEDSMDYKLVAKNKYHSSKVTKFSVSDIPDSAYTKIHLKNEDEVGDLEIKQDSNNQVNIYGTSNKNAKIKVENDDMNTVKTMHADSNGKWNLTLPGAGDKKEKDYTVYAKIPGLLQSLGNDITVKNPNYVKPTKKSEAKKETQKSENTDSSDTSTSNSTPHANKNKSSQSDAKQGYTDDMNEYLSNKYPDVSFTLSDNEATFVVPDAVAYLKKNAMKAYVQPLFDRNELFANANGLKESPAFLVKTQSGSNIARTSIFGFKVYADK
ncbi:hypothetical protein [Companilactobacillus insicii]|uniref:hypothetical protein n=1 Tax=Companilactobacillus insicii TaxID=1732567 RepID=UPI000F791B64|nr:hypothetical protein [Companilactobacillus insicii]